MSGAAAPPGKPPCHRSVVQIFYGDHWDPALEFAVQQIKWWLDFWVSHRGQWATLTVLWITTLAYLEQAAYDWAVVKGHVAATICTLDMYGWTPSMPPLSL